MSAENKYQIHVQFRSDIYNKKKSFCTEKILCAMYLFQKVGIMSISNKLLPEVDITNHKSATLSVSKTKILWTKRCIDFIIDL